MQGFASHSAACETPQHVSNPFEMSANGQFQMRKGAQLHMFISQPPCGDACIFDTDIPAVIDLVGNNIIPVADAADMPVLQHADCLSRLEKVEPSTSKLPTITFSEPTSTGNHPLTHDSSSSQTLPSHPVSYDKFVTSSEPDAEAAEQSMHSPDLLSGSRDTQQQAQHAQHAVSIGRPKSADLSQVGSRGRMKVQQVRRLDANRPVPREIGGLCRKPGRGDATLSMSCSDKLARWNVLGVQVFFSLLVLFTRRGS